jgi:pullulanase
LGRCGFATEVSLQPLGICGVPIMASRANHIIQAWLSSPTGGVIELARDWKARHAPPIKFSGGLNVRPLGRVPDHTYGTDSGYFETPAGDIFFFLPRPDRTVVAADPETYFLAGDFNGWGEAVGASEWQLTAASLDGEPVWLWSGRAVDFKGSPPQRFKFVTGKGRWLAVPDDAPNAAGDDGGNRNRMIDPDRTGRHLFAFELEEPIDLTQAWRVHWTNREEDHSVPLRPGAFFYAWETDLRMGALVEAGRTVFRLFAPRARRVELVLVSPAGEESRHALGRYEHGSPGDQCVWEVAVEGDWVGAQYSYRLEGPSDEFGLFDPDQPVLDPYAKAALGRAGPGVIVREQGAFQDDFRPPAWQDLVICEAHVRDLAALAPTAATPQERQGFRGLRQWVDSPDFYLDRLGVNCVELQPVQEFDNESVDEYHWGYMTNNFFAPESSYAADPARATGIEELQEVVRAFHRRGIAVVLDVVYNHVGVPGHLMFVDKLYYFTTTAAGDLMNWSGCGNDLRADAAMAKRLIIDSCIYLMRTFGVDGFRFDLAELLGVEVLRDIEVALKQAKQDVILIAEPWSFRGHIAGALSETGWASWNDGYRRFLKDFVKGGASRESFEYYFKGSPWHFAHWPAQTINYVESHDDRTWIDEITENVDGNGHLPTANDRRRTHLMAAVLFSSIGIPMMSAGQDFLRSKHGFTNSYQRGDLNALDYRRMERFPSTHAYFADWIAFRRSAAGRLMRHFSRATETFFRFSFAPDTNAVAVLFNADLSQGDDQLLFAINPTQHDVEVPLDETAYEGKWTRVADHEQFNHSHHPVPPASLPDPLWLPALGCGLWRRVS